MFTSVHENIVFLSGSKSTYSGHRAQGVSSAVTPSYELNLIILLFAAYSVSYVARHQANG